MTAIWKTVLSLTDRQSIEVPSGAEFLCAREQFENICVWYRCDPSAPKVSRKVVIVGTGLDAPPFSDPWTYLGTASLDGGSLMFHVFTEDTRS